MNDTSIQKTGSQKAGSRNRAIDFIKVIACIDVVCLHTIGRDTGIVNYWLYYLSGLAIPLFMMTVGFFLFRKKDKITLEYTARKIGGIFFFCLCWVTLIQVISAVRILITSHNIYESIPEITRIPDIVLKDLIQDGNMGVFWFLGSLMLLYLFAYFYFKYNRTSTPPKNMACVLCGWACHTNRILRF